MEEVKKSTDTRLVKRAIKGDVDAYGELIALHKEYLYRMAFLHSRNEDAALEIVQDTVLKGFHSIKTLRNPEAFRTWLTQILIHVSSDYYRKNIPCIPMEGNEPESVNAGISAEEKLDLYAAIHQLPEKYRMVIILKYFDGLKQNEIADILKIPRGTVSVYLTRAKQELRECLREGYLNG